MRVGSIKPGVVWCALLVFAGCATQTSTAPQPTYAPQPMYAPQPTYAPQQNPAPVQYSYAAGAQPIVGFVPTFAPPPPIPLPLLALGVTRPVNTRALFSSPVRARCPRFQAVPGKWVTLDCDPQMPISAARPLSPPMGLQEQVLPLSVDHRTDGLEWADQGSAGGRGGVHGVLAFDRDGQRDPSVG